MQIGHAGKHRRTAGAHSVLLQRFGRGGDDLRMIGEPQIIVGTKIDDGTRFPLVLDRGARIGAIEHFGFVKRRLPRPGLFPFRKASGRRQWIASIADNKIAETEIGVKARLRFVLGIASHMHNFKFVAECRRINSISGSCGVPTPHGSFSRRE